jgi:hypothetical protein
LFTLCRRRIHPDGFDQSQQEAIMRSKKKNPSRAPAPVYRAIKVPPPLPPPIAPPADQRTAQAQPGEAGKAAVTAAALHQLNRYAQDIQDFLEVSQMETIVSQLSADLNPAKRPPLRLHRD